MSETGMIMLIKTRFCPISWLIRKSTKSNWNHCCLVLDSNYILDYTSNQTKIKSINSYSNKLLYKTKIIKIANFNYDEKWNLVERALGTYEGFKFEWHLFLISIIQIFLGKRPAKDTCSGFVAKLLKECCWVTFDKPYYFIIPEDLFQRRMK